MLGHSPNVRAVECIPDECSRCSDRCSPSSLRRCSEVTNGALSPDADDAGHPRTGHHLSLIGVPDDGTMRTPYALRLKFPYRYTKPGQRAPWRTSRDCTDIVFERFPVQNTPARSIEASRTATGQVLCPVSIGGMQEMPRRRPRQAATATPAKAGKSNGNGANLGFEAQLFRAALLTGCRGHFR